MQIQPRGKPPPNSAGKFGCSPTSPPWSWLRGLGTDLFLFACPVRRRHHVGVEGHVAQAVLRRRSRAYCGRTFDGERLAWTLAAFATVYTSQPPAPRRPEDMSRTVGSNGAAYPIIAPRSSKTFAMHGPDAAPIRTPPTSRHGPKSRGARARNTRAHCGRIGGRQAADTVARRGRLCRAICIGTGARDHRANGQQSAPRCRQGHRQGHRPECIAEAIVTSEV